MPATCGKHAKKSTFPKKALEKVHFCPKSMQKKSTFSQKTREKVYFRRKSNPPNPDLATGLRVLDEK